MSGSETEDWECPLCLEELDVDDRGFFPCECGYQICRFCHNRLSEDYGGRCPACRRLYSEQTPRWKPISPAQVARIKHEKKAKEREKREIESNSRRHLANVRVVQKNLVYVIGLPASLATEEILRSHDYFGQFGRINKIVINRRQNGSSAHHPTVGVYVTYAVKDDATRAINAVDGSMLESRVLRATFGTTKYCSYYLRNIPCQNPGCMYLHEPGEEADSFTKEDLAANGSRAEMKTGQQDEDETSERASSQSPGGQLGGGRVATAPSGGGSGTQGSRSHNILQGGGAAQNGGAAAGRGRKPQELNGGRSHSEDVHTADVAGSALPATASWASRAMVKKANEAADGRGRKSDAGSAMTLRMVPAARNKSAKAAGNGTRGGGKTADGAAGGASTQHHPMLQQMSRERKQQLRHQNRAQNKEVEAGTASGESRKKAGAVAAAEALPKQNHRQTKKVEALKEIERPMTNMVADKQQAQQAKDEDQHVAEQGADNAFGAQTVTPADGGTAVDRTAPSYANSALSFQTITDSLFEQLNAKVSTPNSSATLPAFGGLGGHAMGVAGHPGASVDPMLFPPTAGDATHGLFGGVSTPQWADEVAASRGAYVQSPLSSLLGDPATQGAPTDGMREHQHPGAARRRSRWDFARADEASAQAELQSVLGRGAGQLQLRPTAGEGPEFASSRDLGMFGTPVHGGYGGGPWGAAQTRPQEAAAPFPPPGFGARQHRADTLPSDSGSALLSQLMGSAGLGVAASGLGTTAPGPEGLLHGGFTKPQALQDPAILTSHIAVPAMQGAAAGDQQQQQQPALNSLLARLSLGRSETVSSLSQAQPFAPAAPFAQLPAASGFVDPAIMNVGRLDSLGRSATVGSVGLSSPTRPPPGIASPPAVDSGALAVQQQPGMVSRSTNSSGRSRFLNHFERTTGSGPAGTRQHGVPGMPAPAPGHAVPPGLPTTGIFGELLRRAREDPQSGIGAATGAGSAASESAAYVSGRLILDDLGHHIHTASREVQDLRAKLSSVIGQSQSNMWVLAAASQPAADAPQPATATAASPAAGHRSAVGSM